MKNSRGVAATAPKLKAGTGNKRTLRPFSFSQVIITTIPHKHQRYPTVGDWYVKNKTLFVIVSKMGNKRYELLVAVHELIEKILCEHRGITQKKVDAFDRAFEKARKPGNEDEPGFDPRAPYREEHKFATRIELLLANELGIDWQKYDKKICSL